LWANQIGISSQIRPEFEFPALSKYETGMTRSTATTPFGTIHLLEKDGRLWIACFDSYIEHFSTFFEEALSQESPILKQAKTELEEYFLGKRREFNVPLGAQLDRWELGTAFENRAWQTLLKIGFGQKISYKEQALWMGNPKAIRAVGRANGKNPLCIFVPCHRVVGAHGSLVGYGGGLEMKAYLLNHERKISDLDSFTLENPSLTS
jgi:methylated-DNA-[protein]-cysteine S-methyltransferase